MPRILWTTLVAIACCAAATRAGTLDKQYVVTLEDGQFKVDGAASAFYLAKDTMFPCEALRFENHSGVTIRATNFEAPPGRPLKPPVVAPDGATTPDMPFCCTVDVGNWYIWVDDWNDPATAPATVRVHVVVVCRFPATGSIGIVVLGLLLAGTAVFLLARGRAAE